MNGLFYLKKYQCFVLKIFGFFCVFGEYTNFKIFDVIIDITDSIVYLEPEVVSNEIWSDISSIYKKYFEHVVTLIAKTGN